MIKADKKKALIFFAASLLWMAVIFCFSSKNGDETSAQSGHIVNMITDTVNIDASGSVYDTINFIVRKTAHFVEYAILGVLYMLTIVYCNKPDKNKIRVTIITALCCIYAISDEFHQSFSDGREPAVRDVIIDTLGGLFGGALCLFILYRIINKRKEVKSDDSRKNG